MGIANFEIREITADDKTQIVSYISEGWGSHLCVSRGKLFDASLLPGFICKKDGKILGLITYSIVNNECEITTLNSSVCRAGLGTMLINKVMDKAREQKCRRVWLITTNDNTKAIRFYQKRGFEWCGFYHNAMDVSRKLKPQIPELGEDNIPIKHEIEFEMIIY